MVLSLSGAELAENFLLIKSCEDYNFYLFISVYLLLSSLRFDFTKRYWGIRMPFMKYFRSGDKLVVCKHEFDLVPDFKGFLV